MDMTNEARAAGARGFETSTLHRDLSGFLLERESMSGEVMPTSAICERAVLWARPPRSVDVWQPLAAASKGLCARGLATHLLFLHG